MNGHHQQNGVENMMLFEVVKMGKSAMQVSMPLRSHKMVIQAVEINACEKFSVKLQHSKPLYA